MATLRFKALEIAMNRPKPHVSAGGHRSSELFGINVFTLDKMRDYLSKSAYKAVLEAVNTGTPIGRETASEVASAMKAWAMNKGATHYTHWFQPLTGSTAEKHDAFFDVSSDGRAIESFSGEELAQREPDASSFPSGGLRTTFEARGYTAWDPSSPAFIMEIQNGKTLCIPTIFVSYTGEALDYKAPLLRSNHALEQAALKVCRYFDKNVSKVTATLGIEQEYFLVDRALFHARPDLMMSGRTLMGHSPARGQQLEDHYFGSIPERVYAFMVDFEEECYKLGIPLKTRHNEVAPSQFECAPIFEDINLAVDHNQLLMDLIERVGRRHDFKVLLHEKPFAGINGSGKHNNWSLGSDTGGNLLSPGKTPKNNLQFLTFFVNTIMAVYRHANLLRAGIASVSNDHRLGANEAPPAIISIFVGGQLSEMLDEIETKVVKGKIKKELSTGMRLGIPKIPELQKDNTDRNRTSPFAFTGNKFEFRAVGSSANCAQAMTVLNTAMAQQLDDFHAEVESLINKGTKKDEAILSVLRKYIELSKSIRFEGNNYSEEWATEAKKRGLSNIKNTAEALDAWLSKESIALLTHNSVLNEQEIHARYEIMQESYTKKLQIESRVLADLASNHIIPTAVAYQQRLVENAKGLKDLGIEKNFADSQLGTIKKISQHITAIRTQCDEMTDERRKANTIEDAGKRSKAYNSKVKPYIESIREHIDKLELLVDDELWPMPKYRELLFIR